MTKKKCPECPKCLPGWLVQFGDLMSLLLTFFILLLSMAVMDKKKVEEYFDIMKKAMGFLDQSSDVREQTDEYSNNNSNNDSDDNMTAAEEGIEQASEQIQELVQSQNNNAADQTQVMQITKGKNEFVLDIPSTIMFKPAEYKINDAASKRFIAKIARVIRSIPRTFSIEVIGYTDNGAYKNNDIPRDDWDLSALRAIEVVKELIKNRIDPGQLKASAYASYHPKSEVASDNRRVEIRFFSENDQSNILNEENFFDRLE
ncbi:flagellar motor protein MotB [Malaciobacter molluscorum LMG 25693]|uniref:Flagellar motor protein MotB n=1 Tax=Malaciobacter molluscorum LMG 25693 TaxID=870501 RepID=A0A2G1DJ84_9BACT|nr:flagellar motor protein MotB [Malaciobacter molluscorum]AXX93137.1 flagellar motor stator protein [Malaciobacter molluscorum LMG 25693]PHO18396.1 flagellar motor protein MotB [Malaciobacter molluscorum LMG 25693]RXJ95595.1 flagellar motor protein MotB [Malaciobacter molluscorum]